MLAPTTRAACSRSPLPKPRRPWFLSVALASAWVIGAMAVLVSAMTLSLLRVSTDEYNLDIDRKPDLTATERTRQKETFAEYTS